MKRLFGQTVGFALLAFGTLAVTPSCANNDQSIYIEHVLAPPANRQNGVCIYTADATQPTLSSGTLDIGMLDTYHPFLLVGSQLIERGETTSVRSESNRVHINGAVVRLTDANGAAIGSSFTTLGSGFIDPQVNNAPSFAVVELALIDADHSSIIGGQLQGTNQKLYLANVKVFGKTLGGVDLESAELQFPVNVCRGCLVQYSFDPATKTTSCASSSASGSSSSAATITPCVIGQDENVPCPLCQALIPARAVCAAP